MNDPNQIVRLADREIGSGLQPFVIAEISANHNGSIEDAVALIHAAGVAGADAIKLQHYTPETITVRSGHPDFRITGGTLWDGRQLADLYADAMMPWEWTEELAAAAGEAGLIWFSSPFDRTAVDFLAARDVPAFKIASFELVDLPLIRYAASHGKPLVISTGMASLGEIDAAVDAAVDGGASGVVLLRCNSSYPAEPSEMDLAAIPVMREIWGVPVGLSDHTLSTTSAVAAVALGACVIEKHITLDRTRGGPDAAFSLEPAEFGELVATVGTTLAALGTPRFGPSRSELKSLAFRRSLRIVERVRAGEPFTSANVRSVRPAGGLLPDQLVHLMGLEAAVDLEVGDPVTWDVVRAGAGGDGH